MSQGELTKRSAMNVLCGAGMSRQQPEQDKRVSDRKVRAACCAADIRRGDSEKRSIPYSSGLHGGSDSDSVLFEGLSRSRLSANAGRSMDGHLKAAHSPHWLSSRRSADTVGSSSLLCGMQQLSTCPTALCAVICGDGWPADLVPVPRTQCCSTLSESTSLLHPPPPFRPRLQFVISLDRWSLPRRQRELKPIAIFP